MNRLRPGCRMDTALSRWVRRGTAHRTPVLYTSPNDQFFQVKVKKLTLILRASLRRHGSTGLMLTTEPIMALAVDALQGVVEYVIGNFLTGRLAIIASRPEVNAAIDAGILDFIEG